MDGVQAYMGHIQVAAEQSVRTMLRGFSLREGMKGIDSVVSVDFLDDGMRICLQVEINRALGSALFNWKCVLIPVFSSPCALTLKRDRPCSP